MEKHSSKQRKRAPGETALPDVRLKFTGKTAAINCSARRS